MGKIRAGIVGYGNLGRGVEKVIQQNADFSLEAILTRRPPDGLATGSPTVPKLRVDKALDLKGAVDVMILCGGSATDLPVQGPEFAKSFNTVDSYDTHAKISDYYKEMDAASRKAGLVSVVSAGWDPGLFSMNRVLAQSILPNGEGCTFWGKGVSQGHSDAIRRVDGVRAAVQYTIPVAEAIEKARKGEGNHLLTREKHIRECFVVTKEGADKAFIENSIKAMPHYFSDYDTVVHFIDIDEYNTNHTGMAHGGFVIHSGTTGGAMSGTMSGTTGGTTGVTTSGKTNVTTSGTTIGTTSGTTNGTMSEIVNDTTSGNRHIIEFSLGLCHNAEFTASVLVAYARAAFRFFQEGRTGALTVLDIPVSYLSAKSGEELIKELL